MAARAYGETGSSAVSADGTRNRNERRLPAGLRATRRTSVTYVKKRRFALQNEEGRANRTARASVGRPLMHVRRGYIFHEDIKDGGLLDGVIGAAGRLCAQRAMLLGQLRVQRDGAPLLVGIGQHGFERDRRYLPATQAAEELVKLGAG